MDEKRELLASTLLVSVIVPVYKVQEYLPKCLESLVLQTYKNIEIILVDDGSPDNSLAICRQYAIKDPRVKIVVQANAGVTAARLNGFLHSCGDFIMFVDSDDYVSPNIVELMLQVQQKYQVDMVSCQYYDVKKERAVPALVRPSPGYYNKERIRQLLATNFLYDKCTEMAGMSGYLWTKLFKKRFVQAALRVGRGLIHSEDQLGLFKVLYTINSMYIMREPLYYYVVRQGQATSSYNVAYWKNFELFFTRLQEIDQENYLKKQLPDRVVMTLKSLIKMEFTNEKLSFFQQYHSVKRNFSEELRSLGKSADLYAMGRKARLQYYLAIHRRFLLYGAFIYLNRFLKSFHSRE